MDGRGQEIVFGALVRRLRSQRLRAGNEFLGDSEPPPRQLWDLRERCKLPYPAGFGLEPRLQMNFGRIESPESRLVAANTLSMLNSWGGCCPVWSLATPVL